METDTAQTTISEQPQEEPVIQETKKGNELLTFLSLHKKIVIISSIIFIAVCIVGVAGLVLYSRGHVGQKIAIKSVKVVPYITVLSTTPGNSSNNNPDNASISITFSQPVKPDSLRGFFTVNPMIPGTFSQGSNPNQVTFTANYAFGDNTSVSVILNKGFESISGGKFLSDYTFNFSTQAKTGTVSFINNTNYTYSYLSSINIGSSLSFSLQVGDGISPDGTIDVYKGDLNTLLASLTYENKTNPGSSYISQDFINNPIDTSSLQKISSTKGLGSNTNFSFKQPPGLYLVAANNNGTMVGFTWVNVTNQGLIVREDDQNVFIAAQDTVSGAIGPDTMVSLYNLENSPQLLKSAKISQSGEVSLIYPEKVDLVVGQTDTGYILVPVSIPQTQADIGVTKNLSNLDKVYLYTNKPTYQAGETVQFSGIVRQDNDAKYTIPSSGSIIKVWIPDPQNVTNSIYQADLPVDVNGNISGAFTVPSSLTPTGQVTSTSVVVYAKLETDGATYITSPSFTSFDVISQQQNAIIKVSFDKTSYLKNQQITAHIIGLDNNGNPLANQQVTYSIYKKDYYENDPTSVASYGADWGEPDNTHLNIPITLDPKGMASVSIDQSSETVSQAVTVAVNGTVNNQPISGAKTILVHQGTIILSFEPSKQDYVSGDTTQNRVYAIDLNGKPLPNQQIAYDIYNSIYDNQTNSYTETTLYEGSVTTDQRGVATISQAVSTTDSLLSIQASATDASGNTSQTQNSFSFSQSPSTISTLYYHTVGLVNFDVVMDKPTYAVGDSANLTITSPFNQEVFVTYESGRIYHSEWLSLNQGSNNYSIPITADLSPSFNLVFSYFRNGAFIVEGMPFSITDQSKSITISTSFDKVSYGISDTPQLTITTTDNQNHPISTNISVNVLDDIVFNLRNTTASGNLVPYFYNPRVISTNSSASVLGIGTGGGCGGGSGYEVTYVPNREGTNLYWNTTLQTDQDGKLTIQLPHASSGEYDINILGYTQTTALTQSQISYAVE